MGKKNARVLSALLVAGMVFGTLPVGASAPSDGDYKAPAIRFSGTKDLINATINSLLAEGKGTSGSARDDALEDAVKEKSGIKLSEMTTMLSLAIYSNRGSGIIDTSKYHLTEADMAKVLDETLKRSYLSDVIKYELIVGENDEVVEIRYSMNDVISIVFDEIDRNGGEENNDRLLKEAAAEAEAEAEAESDIWFRGSGRNPSAVMKAERTSAYNLEDNSDNSDEDVQHEHSYELVGYYWYIAEDSEVGYGCIKAEQCSDDGDTRWSGLNVTYNATAVHYAATETADDNTVVSTFTPIAKSYHKHDFSSDNKSDYTVYWTEDESGNYSAKAVIVCKGEVNTGDNTGEGTGEGTGEETGEGTEVPPASEPCNLVKIIDCVVTSEISVDDVEKPVTTYTAKIGDGDDELVLATKDVEISKEHEHNFNGDRYEFIWDKSYGENDDTDDDGQPDASLFYSADAPDADDPTILYYDSNTGIGISVARKLDWKCTGIRVYCADEDCQGYKDYGESYIIEKDTTVDETNSVIKTVIFNDGANNIRITESKNITKLNLSEHWNEMAGFIRANPDYYGLSTPYWTSKNTIATPLGAIKSLCNYDIDAEIPDYGMDQMVAGLTQAFIAYVYQYGPQLLAMRDAAIEYIQSAGEITDIQKLLLLHDWLSKTATFDMNSLVSLRSGGNSDPISMTPFGALLDPNQLGIDNVYGAVCLGYTAAYTYLVQNIFSDKYKSDGEWLSSGDADHIVDFVQIKFHSNVGDCSVAGTDGGFGADEIFNEPHYFNAVRLKDGKGTGEDGVDNVDTWYYVDACYDDISVEVISQYRVETDGNISHKYFLNSPQSLIDQFDGNYDYFDSAYDGWEYYKNGTKTDDDGVERPVWEKKKAENETMYDDDQYEETWFSGIVSEIFFDADNWYYIEGDTNSYTAMKDLFGNSSSSGSGSSGDMDQLSEYKNKPEYADKFKFRSKDAPDKPESRSTSSDIGSSSGFEQYDDLYAETIFHFGYGTFGIPETDEDPETDEEKNNGKYKALITLDNEYMEIYPDLVHSLVMLPYESDSKTRTFLLNIADRIMMIKDMAVPSEAISSVEAIEFVELKAYDTPIEVMTDGRPFTGMSFFRLSGDGERVFTIKNHPLAGIALNNVVTNNWDYIIDETTGEVVGRIFKDNTVTPTLSVSIATNYSNSYTITDGDDKIPYKKEAINFDPDYYRFFDEDKTEDKNRNNEFMWCANVVDNMILADVLDDLEKGEKEEINIEATCGSDGYTQQKTKAFGLSKGDKAISEDDKAVGHHYFYVDSNKTGEDKASEKCWICLICSKCLAASGEDAIQESDHKMSAPKFEWSEDLTSCVLATRCTADDCDYAETVECSVTANKDDEDNIISYTAVAVFRDKEYSETKDVITEPEVIIGDIDGDGNVGMPDLIYLRRYLAKLETSIIESAADIDGDGSIGMSDLIRLRRYLAKLDVLVPES